MNVELQRLEHAVQSHLGPYLGESMAHAALVGHCRSLGIDTDLLGGEQVETLLGRLQQGMKIFVGSEKAEQLVGRLREELDLGGGA